MRRNDDRVRVLLDHALPPSEGLPADHTSRVSPPRAAPRALCRLVDVTHHQEQQVANAKRVALPRAFDGKPAFAHVDARRLRVLAGRVNPLPEPPSLGFVESISVVIPRDVVDVFTTMLFQHRILADDLLTFLVLWRPLRTGKIPEVESDVPIETLRALGLLQWDREALAPHGEIECDVGIREHPNAERPRRGRRVSSRHLSA